jgi:hypothetical protein
MDLNRKLSSKLVAFDGRHRAIAYSDEENHRLFLDEIIKIGLPEMSEVTVHAVCPYVWTNPDKWYAEHEPLIRYEHGVSAAKQIIPA